jgi:nucleotide-binding universal stress UspA family protein
MYGKILVPVDGSETAALGLEEAIRLATSQGSTLRLLHVVDDLAAYASPQAAVYSQQLLEALRARGQAILADAKELARKRGLAAETKWVEATGGSAGEAIIEEAGKWPADLIVLGTHGRRGIARLVLGSDAEHVVRSASVPVLLVRVARAPRPS